MKVYMSRRGTGDDLKGDRLNRMCHSEVVKILCSEIKDHKGSERSARRGQVSLTGYGPPCAPIRGTRSEGI